jgi:predicted transposase/invertase (TIGR01784 family)
MAKKKREIIPVTNDVMFKALFVEDSGDYELLRSFLSATLKIPKSDIVNTLIKNPELVPLAYEGKMTRLDILLTTSKHTINVEMQVASTEYYKERSLLYCARMYHDQLKEGEDYGKLQPCIGIHILNFTLFPDCTEYHSSFSMREDTRNEPLTDKMRLHYLELPKVRKVSDKNKPDENDELRLWMQLFKAKTEEELDMLNATNVTAIQHGVKAVRSLSEDEKIREYVRQREKAIQDYYSDMAVAESRGEKRGRAEGIEIGKLRTLAGLVKDGILTLADAAKRVHMTEEEFNSKITELGV